MSKILLTFTAFLVGALCCVLTMVAASAEAYGDSEQDELILEEMSSDEIEPVYKEIRCFRPGSADCMEACAGIGAYCAQFVLHPKRVEGGMGQLYWCKGGSRPTYTCSYRFANSDTCHFVRPGPLVLCGYEGG